MEFEQGGSARAEYGTRLLQTLASSLAAEFGRGFDVSNLRYMRVFYQAFPIRDALRPELSWTHYRTLLRVESDSARQWYMCSFALYMAYFRVNWQREAFAIVFVMKGNACVLNLSRSFLRDILDILDK